MIYIGVAKTRNGVRWSLQLKIQEKNTAGSGRAGQDKPALCLENVVRQLYSEVRNNAKYLGYQI